MWVVTFLFLMRGASGWNARCSQMAVVEYKHVGYSLPGDFCAFLNCWDKSAAEIMRGLEFFDVVTLYVSGSLISQRLLVVISVNLKPVL